MRTDKNSIPPHRDGWKKFVSPSLDSGKIKRDLGKVGMARSRLSEPARLHMNSPLESTVYDIIQLFLLQSKLFTFSFSVEGPSFSAHPIKPGSICVSSHVVVQAPIKY